MFARLLVLSQFIGMGWCAALAADNQTAQTSKIHSEHSLPFRVKLEKANFELPMGIQSYVHGIYEDKWLLITGRVDGMHTFVANSTNNFPINLQNTTVFVIDPLNKKTYTRSLRDVQSGLTREQIDLLSVTAAQAYQTGNTLYITGGYGVDTSTGNLDTKNALTAINIPGLIHWVVHPSDGETAVEHIRQIFDDTFKVTGGYMDKIKDNPTLLIMGQDFDGFYMDASQQPPVFQQYTEQVRRFHIHDDGVSLSFTLEPPLPSNPDPNYRRRDLNVVPIVKVVEDKLQKAFVALSGVFTLTGGIWTVPVEISAKGHAKMANPDHKSTFKQGMNNYDCASFGMFSKKTGDMYTLLLGGISFGYFKKTHHGYEFETSEDIPFISQTSAIRLDKRGHFKQYFMKSGGFPRMLSTTVNAGKPLFFGAEGEVILLDDVPKFSNNVIKLDEIKKKTLIGYVVGGIVSTLPNTEVQADSSPSPYLFKVFVEPN